MTPVREQHNANDQCQASDLNGTIISVVTVE